jgi:hypothetical protein
MEWEKEGNFCRMLNVLKFYMKKTNDSEVIMRQLHKFHLHLLAILLG